MLALEAQRQLRFDVVPCAAHLKCLASISRKIFALATVKTKHKKNLSAEKLSMLNVSMNSTVKVAKIEQKSFFTKTFFCCPLIFTSLL